MPLHLASLHIYPIKGAAGTAPREWEVDVRGFRYDRRWMLVEPSGEFITQRENPALALIRPRFQPPHLVIEAPGMPPLTIALAPMGGRPLNVRIWDDRVDALLPDQRADQWFTDYLGSPTLLAWMPDACVRPVDPFYAEPADQASFADGFPFLVIAEASLDDLNSRLAEPLPMNRFRPNLVVGGATPFAEDEWRRIRIGSMEFRVVKPCARCVITTTNQLTGARGVEPLRTLATYRRIDGKVMFGQNVLHDGPGRLALGDLVNVVAMTDKAGILAPGGDSA